MDCPLERDDVNVEEIRDECDECSSEITEAWTVAVDFRSAGMTERLGRYCQPCAKNIAGRIRDGLPASPGSPRVPPR